MTFLSKIPSQAVTLLSMITSIVGYKQGSTFIYMYIIKFPIFICRVTHFLISLYFVMIVQLWITCNLLI